MLDAILRRPRRKVAASLMAGCFLAVISAAPVRAEVKELRMAYQQSMAFLVVDVLLAKRMIEGRAAAAGLDPLTVSAVRFSSGPAANEALLKGEIEVGGAGLAPFLELWANTRGTANVRGIAPINDSPLYLITTNASVKSAKDLAPSGKVAVPAPGSIQGLFLRMLAERDHGHARHLDPAMVSMTSVDTMKALGLGDGSLSAYVGSIPFNLTAMALPGAREIANSFEFTGGAHTLVSLFVTEKFKTENPKAFAALSAAIDDAMAFITANPAETAEIFSTASKGATAPARVMEVLSRKDVAYSTTPRGTMAFATFMSKLGLLKSLPTTWKDVYWENVHGRDGS
jgi:NitT/TauT family transport system substrate-binding protein